MYHEAYKWLGKTYFRLTWNGESRYNIQALYKGNWVDIENFNNYDHDNADDALSFALNRVIELKQA